MLARMLKESLPSPVSLLSFLAAAWREGLGVRLEPTSGLASKFIAIKFLVLSAIPVHKWNSLFLNLVKMALLAGGVGSRVGGRRRGEIPFHAMMLCVLGGKPCQEFSSGKQFWGQPTILLGGLIFGPGVWGSTAQSSIPSTIKASAKRLDLFS